MFSPSAKKTVSALTCLEADKIAERYVESNGIVASHEDICFFSWLRVFWTKINALTDALKMLLDFLSCTLKRVCCYSTNLMVLPLSACTSSW